ncbi:MAG: hypothetical protein H7Z40_06485 [Phycisphaerae bacterium]|nr:hypothetical protein [Gemmatimonadaceae bacterium]
MTNNSSQLSSKSMNSRQLRSVFSHRRGAGAVALSMCLLSSCSNSDILAVTDPDLLPPDVIESPSGPAALRIGALSRFVTAFDGGVDAFTVVTGNLADELRSSDTFDGRILPNKRFMNDNLPEMTGTYLNLHRARSSATNAIAIFKEFAPTQTLNIGELYMYRAYTEDFFGEMYCSGVPFSEPVGSETNYGEPQTTVQIFERSVASFDSALALVGTNVNLLNGSRIGKARALLNLGQYAAAATVVASVPTTFRLISNHCFGGNCTENGNYSAAAAPSSRYTPSNNEGINGLNFLPTVPDPRLPWTTSTRSGFNTLFTSVYMPLPLKVCPSYRGTGCPGTRNTTGENVLADGIEARLIEAEARLQGKAQSDRDAVFATLNTLRATGIPGFPVTALVGTAPTTDAAAVTQLFNERAYWMYLTGHRLGDLRRLIRQYGRNAEAVFPTGELQAPLSGPYGSDVNFPVPAQEKNNPKFTGCINRNA